MHLNFALREPLAPSPEPLEPADWEGRDDGRPWTELREPGTALDPLPLPAGRGVVVCGPTAESVAEPVARFAARLGWPVLAEPTSGLRPQPARCFCRIQYTMRSLSAKPRAAPCLPPSWRRCTASTAAAISRSCSSDLTE